MAWCLALPWLFWSSLQDTRVGISNAGCNHSTQSYQKLQTLVEKLLTHRPCGCQQTQAESIRCPGP
jgi:hypothetical protein